LLGHRHLAFGHDGSGQRSLPPQILSSATRPKPVNFFVSVSSHDSRVLNNRLVPAIASLFFQARDCCRFSSSLPYAIARRKVKYFYALPMI
jgi:hypothetical protein